MIYPLSQRFFSAFAGLLLFAMVFSATVGCQTGIPAAKYPGPVDPDAPEEFTETASGLKYRILRKGDGNNPTAADSVMCHYEGKLINGDVFDSSYTSGQPLTFSLRGVIPGWTEGMQYVREGGMIELEVPSELGYGKNGSPPVIPPDATLRFRVELIAIQ